MGERSVTTSFSTWGRYESRDYARLARNRFADVPGAHYRVRYMPDERYPFEPYAVLCFDYEEDADAFDANGEVKA